MKEKFTWWYERVFSQSPSMCQLKYDDEKMWEAWQAGYRSAKKLNDKQTNPKDKNDLEL